MKQYLYAGYVRNELTDKLEFRCSNRADYQQVLKREGKQVVSWYALPNTGLSRKAAQKLADQMQKTGFATADEQLAHNSRMVERVNLMSGEKYMEAADTPRSCSPASESYWSM